MEEKMIRYCYTSLQFHTPCCMYWQRVDWDSNTQSYISHKCSDIPIEIFCHNLINPKMISMVNWKLFVGSNAYIS